MGLSSRLAIALEGVDGLFDGVAETGVVVEWGLGIGGGYFGDDATEEGELAPGAGELEETDDEGFRDLDAGTGRAGRRARAYG